ncbi:SAC3 family protein A-like isoform X2 [Zingiber officinale]|uniref:SAC3 family protein A-like isoform X2 n=1 Tax=Zingiber officinale TaxID=94328 RepID=UPI001C4BF481|nr:SAC3 family protein A-like isoform X2 [Zingiber officinale]XP_042461261.1 SAC3 family protein A-like isoform X2 [Zingiber officinale]
MSDSGGMTSKGAEPIAVVDSRSTEAVDVAQTHGSLYSSSQPAVQSWSSSTGEQSVPNSSYYYDPQSQVSMSGDAQGMSFTSHASTSSNQVGVNSTQPYSGYAPYSSSTVPYNYNSVGFQNYYYSNHPLGNDSTTQQVEGDQNPGAAYQPLSAFPNSGSYVAPTSYLGTYYNAGDNQTGTGYENNSYNYQTGLWNDANYHNYPQHLYSSYTTSATTVAQSSTTASTNSLYYQQQYNKWPYCYNQAMPAVNGIAGTDNSHAAPSLQSAGYSAVGVGAGYPYSSNQPPPPGTTSWREDSKPPGVSSFQEAATPYNVNKTWEVVPPAMQTPPVNQQSYFNNLLKPTPLPNENQDNQPKVIYSQAPHIQHSSSNHVPEIFQTPQQTAPTTEVRQFSKVQIPTNPRIAPNVGVSLLKTQKESSGTNAPTRPAYVSVSMPKPSDKSSAEDHGKTKGTFPPSLCAYVDRSFARCKDDSQRSANENILKQVIAKATADGTLFTKEWDIEPLFTLPVEQSDQQSGSPWPITKRSPSRRRSRWEPVADENLNDKLTSVDDNATKNTSLGQVEAAEKVAVKNSGSKSVNGSVGYKFLPSQQQSILPKFSQRAMKKPRFSHTLSATENVDHSSDSDKEQNLTKYYASAIALADSPEEKKRRENRVKRFEKGHGNQTDLKISRSKIAAGSGAYTSRTSGLLKPTSYENGQSKAVEDIDWDSLTVKGTCQEIEKRYLRLTSAPEPSTVRPEEILEKALHMVQTSQKSYLYRCDQLKSIRQDLTVQRIQNTLTVKVYETHARLALEAGDLPEYNQCQSQLKRLYAEGIKGCYMEFSAYNLLSIILHSNNKRELLSSMARLSADAKSDKAVKHALSVHSAVSSGNYILFFRLYKEAPNLNTFFMNIYMEKMRFEAMKCMCKSYRPVVPVSYITRALGFSKLTQGEEIEDASIDGYEECEEWLRAHGAVITSSNAELQLDTKASASTLYMPEVEDAVAHGDANLAVDNFLTRTL